MRAARRERPIRVGAGQGRGESQRYSMATAPKTTGTKKKTPTKAAVKRKATAPAKKTASKKGPREDDRVQEAGDQGHHQEAGRLEPATAASAARRLPPRPGRLHSRPPGRHGSSAVASGTVATTPTLATRRFVTAGEYKRSRARWSARVSPRRRRRCTRRWRSCARRWTPPRRRAEATAPLTYREARTLRGGERPRRAAPSARSRAPRAVGGRPASPARARCPRGWVAISARPSRAGRRVMADIYAELRQDHAEILRLLYAAGRGERRTRNSRSPRRTTASTRTSARSRTSSTRSC